MDIFSIKSLLDVGCGVGVLGICLAKLNTDIKAVFQDRNALACSFTEMNCLANNILHAEVSGSLMLVDAKVRKFDLIVSNLPAKAGEPVLRTFVRKAPRFLTDSGMVAIVIIKPIAPAIEEEIQSTGGFILSKHEGKNYTVFIYNSKNVESFTEKGFFPYSRSFSYFAQSGTTYGLQSCMGLPEFDTLSYRTILAQDTMSEITIKGRSLFWNPGQGHLPVFIVVRKQLSESIITLASRDLLSLTVTENNLQAVDPHKEIETLHRPDFLLVSGKYNFVAVFPDVDPGVLWYEPILAHIERILVPDGRVLFCSKSTHIYRLLNKNRIFSVLIDTRFRGFRCVLLKIEH